MTQKELEEKLVELHETKLFIEYQIQNYKERLDRLIKCKRNNEENPKNNDLSY